MEHSGQIYIQDCYHYHEAHTLAVDEAPGNSILAIAECTHLHTADNIWKTYWTDFSEYKHLLVPSDWPQTYYNVGGFVATVRSDEGCVFGGGLGLKLDTPSNSTWFAKNWTKVPLDYDFDILAKIKLEEEDQALGGVVARLAGTTNEYGILNLFNTTGETFRTYRLSNGSGADLGNYSFVNQAQEWYWIRVQIWGADKVKTKVWHHGEEEPAAWTKEVTYAGVPGPGAVGVCTYDGDFVIDYYSVGVGGIPAPMEGPTLNVYYCAHDVVSDNVVCDPAWLKDMDAYHDIDNYCILEPFDSLRTTWWDAIYGGTAVSIVGGKLHLEEAGDDAYIYMQFPFDGDFDLVIPTDIIELEHIQTLIHFCLRVVHPQGPIAQQAATGVQSDWHNVEYDTFGFSAFSTTHGYYRNANGSAVSLSGPEYWDLVHGGGGLFKGAIRFQRVGSTLKCWYWHSPTNQWEYDGSTDGYTLSATQTLPLWLMIRCYAGVSSYDYKADIPHLLLRDMTLGGISTLANLDASHEVTDFYSFDDFSSIDPLVWNEDDASAILSVVDGKLHFDGSGTAFLYGQKAVLKGDFDLVMPVEIGDTFIHSSSVLLHVSTVKDVWASGVWSTFGYNAYSSNRHSHYRDGSNTSGANSSLWWREPRKTLYRLTRTGSTIKCYFWEYEPSTDAYRWEYANNVNGLTFGESHTDDLYITIRVAGNTLVDIPGLIRTTPMELTSTLVVANTYHEHTALNVQLNILDWSSSDYFTAIIDSSKVDAALTDFPIAIQLGIPAFATLTLDDCFHHHSVPTLRLLQSTDAADSVLAVDEGIHYHYATEPTWAYDGTEVIKALGDDYKKLSVQTTAGVHCYVEIEHWDLANLRAVLHVKVPSISQSVDTTLKLYYDRSMADNDGWVGTVRSAPAKQVWDDDFVAVFHMAQDPSQSENPVFDSTANEWHLGGAWFESADLVDGRFGKEIYLGGSPEHFNRQGGLIPTSVTVEGVCMAPYSPGDYYQILSQQGGGINAWQLRLDSTTANITWIPWRGGAHTIASGISALGKYRYIAGRHNETSGHASIFVEEQEENFETYVGAIDNAGYNGWAVGRRAWNDSDDYFFGYMAEVRLSQIERSDAWCKATYHSLFGNLVSLGPGAVSLTVHDGIHLHTVEDTYAWPDNFRVAVIRSWGVMNSGTRDYTLPGFGTPKAAIIFSTGAYGDDDALYAYPTNNFSQSIGFYDGVAQRLATALTRHALATTSTYERGQNDAVVGIWQSSTGDYSSAAAAWVTDGIRLTWAMDASFEYNLPVTIVLFAGDDVSADVATANIPGTEDASEAVTAPGFQPDLVFFNQCGYLSGSTVHNTLGGLGIAINDGNLTQMCIARGDANAIAAGESTARFLTDRMAGRMLDGSLTQSAELTAFSSTGFTLTAREGSVATRDVQYLALKIARHRLWVGEITTPTSPGTQAVTGPGFRPSFVMQVMSMLTAVDTTVQGANAAVLGHSFVWPTESSISVRSEYGADPTGR